MALTQEEHMPPDAAGRDTRSLRIHHITIYVRDLDRSLEFYCGQLGFTLVVDHLFAEGERVILVEPADGSTGLLLVTPKPGSANFERIGKSDGTVLVTDDVDAQFREWHNRGVHFHRNPQQEIWGGATAEFSDIDGNVIVLAGWDAITREVEARRRAVDDQLEADRRAATELALAREVQARLFPQVTPILRSLEYTGICIQARAVGGDYYDFLNLGPGYLGLVVGDVSGKGIAAALMMSNLQANLRSQCAVARDDLGSALETVSTLFYENTPGAAFSTLFIGLYDDEHGVLAYANCGHPSPIVMRASGAIDWLAPTAQVVGLLPKWSCAIQECALDPGDTLVMFTDGVTEAFDEAGEEFGEDRLVGALTAHRQEAPKALLDAILDELKQFSGREQSDDITLVVARRRSCSSE
jgi:serine phosphatase RsbU (regulator of sigma subunit)/predicted enzyme related to lactoylglutathione lyase